MNGEGRKPGAVAVIRGNRNDLFLLLELRASSPSPPAPGLALERLLLPYCLHTKPETQKNELICLRDPSPGPRPQAELLS